MIMNVEATEDLGVHEEDLQHHHLNEKDMKTGEIAGQEMMRTEGYMRRNMTTSTRLTTGLRKRENGNLVNCVPVLPI